MLPFEEVIVETFRLLHLLDICSPIEYIFPDHSLAQHGIMEGNVSQ